LAQAHHVETNCGSSSPAMSQSTNWPKVALLAGGAAAAVALLWYLTAEGEAPPALGDDQVKKICERMDATLEALEKNMKDTKEMLTEESKKATEAGESLEFSTVLSKIQVPADDEELPALMAPFETQEPPPEVVERLTKLQLLQQGEMDGRQPNVVEIIEALGFMCERVESAVKYFESLGEEERKKVIGDQQLKPVHALIQWNNHCVKEKFGFTETSMMMALQMNPSLQANPMVAEKHEQMQATMGKFFAFLKK